MQTTHDAQGGPRMLEGVTVCMLVNNDVRSDARVQKEAGVLADAGARVSIIGVDRGGQGPWSTEVFRVTLVPPMEPSSHGAWVVRVAINLMSERAFRRALADAAAVARADVYHCHDLDTAWAGMRAAKRTGARLVYDAHELFTERPGFRPWQVRAFRRIERRMLDRADVVFTANEERAMIMADMYGVSRRMVPLLNVPSMQLMNDVPDPAAVAARAALGCERLLLYQGGLADVRGLASIVEGMSLLPSSYHLALMGLGEPGPALRAALSSADSSRIHLWDSVTPDRLISWAAVADAGIVSYLPYGLNNVYCAPNKLFDYVGAGIAVLAADLPPLRRIVTDRGIGSLFAPGDAESFARAVVELFETEDGLPSAQHRARALREQVNWEREAPKLLDAYRDMGLPEPSGEAEHA